MNYIKEKFQIKGIFRIVVFALSFVLIASLISSQIFSGDVSRYSKRLGDAYTFVRDPKQTIDVVFVGNSDAYSAFNPIYMWDKYGVTATVSASPHQTVEECRRAIEVLLETQSPKVAVIEVDMLYDTGDKGLKNKSRLDYFFSKTVNPDRFENAVKTNISLFEFHNFWKNLLKDSRANFSHGYKYNKQIIEVKPYDYMTDTDSAEYPQQYMLEELDGLVNFCFDNDIKVVLTEVFSMVSWSTQQHNAIDEISRKYNIDFIDCNMMYDELGVNMKTAFRDSRGYHVNHKTADVISDYMCRYLMNSYGVCSRKDDEKLAQFWKNDIAEFNKANKIDS